MRAKAGQLCSLLIKILFPVKKFSVFLESTIFHLCRTKVAFKLGVKLNSGQKSEEATPGTWTNKTQVSWSWRSDTRYPQLLPQAQESPRAGRVRPSDRKWGNNSDRDQQEPRKRSSMEPGFRVVRHRSRPDRFSKEVGSAFQGSWHTYSVQMILKRQSLSHVLSRGHTTIIMTLSKNLSTCRHLLAEQPRITLISLSLSFSTT